ncbi:MAG: dihydrofolate synthase, partial [Propionibacteriaceae bacterium]|nr:dihydrofolate synthase [Propionibacteriaceae bacterium]
PVVIDTAHNPHGVRATLAGAQEAFGFEPLVAVLAMMADKDAQGVLELLEPAVNTLVVTQVSDNPRALPVEDLAEMAVDVFGADRVETAPTSTDAVDVAVRIAGRSGEAAGVLVLGSVYLAGEVRALLRP